LLFFVIFCYIYYEISACCLAAVAPARGFVVGIRVVTEIPGGVKVSGERDGLLDSRHVFHRFRRLLLDVRGDSSNGLGSLRDFHVLGDFRAKAARAPPHSGWRAHGDRLRLGSLLLLLLLLLERRETVLDLRRAAAAATTALARRTAGNERETVAGLLLLLALDCRGHDIAQAHAVAHLAVGLGLRLAPAAAAGVGSLALGGADSLGLAALAVSPGVTLGVAVWALRLGESRAAGLAADLVLDVMRFHHLLRLACVGAELAELLALLGKHSHDVQEN